MTLKPGMQAIAIHILFNISRSKDNQTMKFGQLIEYKKNKNFSSKNQAEKEAGGLAPDFFSFLKKLCTR